METATATKKHAGGRPLGVKDVYRRPPRSVQADVRRMVKDELAAMLAPINKEIVRLALEANYEPSRIAAIKEIYERVLGKAEQPMTGQIGNGGPVTIVFQWRNPGDPRVIENEPGE